MDLKEQIDLNNLPEHVAIIMDGNGRWAKQKGHHRIFGHRNGVKAVRETTEAAAELGVKYLTLYAFSTENWSRPKREVNALMELLVRTIDGEVNTLMDNDIRVRTIGKLDDLPPRNVKKLQEIMAQTANNKRMDLILALSYSFKWEMTEAVKQIAEKVKEGTIAAEEVTEDFISDHLSTAGIPDPEIMIRTSGEQRISNFLLWQLAYAELYFTDVFWPAFRKNDFYKAIIDFQHRERRFGKISEQIQA